MKSCGAGGGEGWSLWWRGVELLVERVELVMERSIMETS